MTFSLLYLLLLALRLRYQDGFKSKKLKSYVIYNFIDLILLHYGNLFGSCSYVRKSVQHSAYTKL